MSDSGRRFFNFPSISLGFAAPRSGKLLPERIRLPLSAAELCQRLTTLTAETYFSIFRSLVTLAIIVLLDHAKKFYE